MVPAAVVRSAPSVLPLHHLRPHLAALSEASANRLRPHPQEVSVVEAPALASGRSARLHLRAALDSDRQQQPRLGVRLALRRREEEEELRRWWLDS